MKVKNQKCIRRLSYKTLWASRKRNRIAIIAIALTTLLFTSLLTIAMSMNASYQTYNFRQIGGYSHGSFKDVTDEQMAALTAHPKVKEAGARKTIGFCGDGVFGKVPAEVSYMDKNCTKWSYAQPTEGREPESGTEVAMDTEALRLLGAEPELGTKITITYEVGTHNDGGFKETETFTLVGFWEYDDLVPVHYINVSKEYTDQVEKKAVGAGMTEFRTDLNVMLASSIDIRGQMEQIDTDLGYDWETRNNENSVRIGVNWGYTSAQAASKLDMQAVMAIISFIALVVFTGYLIIYNIFQISVTGDIRFYGLLKTIGTTPRQLKRIIRQQALFLCAAGIPVGLALGYGAGAVLTPVVLETTSLGNSSTTISASSWIFIGATLFSIVTVFLSCSRPGKMAAKVAPVEATKYTEVLQTKKKMSRGAKVYQMAFANMGRNKKKSVLVVLSLALSVTLLNALYSFVGGFDMEKYVSQQTCADFVVSTTDYFRSNSSVPEYITQDMIDIIRENTDVSLSGCGYDVKEYNPQVWIDESEYKRQYLVFEPEQETDRRIASMEHRGNTVPATLKLEGLDDGLFDKLTVVDGDIAPLFDENQNAIALSVSVDDYGNVHGTYPEIGEKITVTYIEEIRYVDSRTGDTATEDTPQEYLQDQIEKSHDMEYTVCALVEVPHAMGFRYSMVGYEAVLPVETLKADSGQDARPLFYLFDAPDDEAESAAESFLTQFTADDVSMVSYESKAILRKEFESFKQMFLLLGTVLCAIIGIVGVLNFFNAIMTGILSRKREFAVLQSVGMTNRQLKAMLIYEGIFYAAASAGAALILSIVLSPFLGRMMGNMFWFFTYRFTILPVIVMIPVFALLGYLIPSMLYGQTAKQSVVERLRESE